MKKSSLFILFVLFVLIMFLLSGCSNKTNSNEENNSISNNSNISVSPTSTENTTNMYNVIELNQNATSTKETELASFSTNLVNRYTNSKHNISVACGLLNGTVIQNGDVFSFWGTLGDTTPEKGYVKADSFDEDGDTVQTYGGGVCQISSTLYNVVLAVPNELTVVERHPHSKPVAYVEQGKDATVSYSSVDFKFKNNSGLPIKIYAEYQDTAITIRIVKIG